LRERCEISPSQPIIAPVTYGIWSPPFRIWCFSPGLRDYGKFGRPRYGMLIVDTRTGQFQLMQIFRQGLRGKRRVPRAMGGHSHNGSSRDVLNMGLLPCGQGLSLAVRCAIECLIISRISRHRLKSFHRNWIIHHDGLI
jgi:hypothetical protein